jgi:hypothetical protein
MGKLEQKKLPSPIENLKLMKETTKGTMISSIIIPEEPSEETKKHKWRDWLSGSVSHAPGWPAKAVRSVSVRADGWWDIGLARTCTYRSVSVGDHN